MKTFLKFLSWIGLLIILIGLVFSYSSSWVLLTSPLGLGSGVGYVMTALVGTIGASLALTGGFIARPRYFWIGTLVVGIAYVASFYGYAVEFEPRFIPGILVMLLPGLACIIAGIIIRKSGSVSF